MKFFKSYEDSPQNIILNRAVNYGDGVFETMLITKGRLPFWSFHYQRLIEGLEKLNIKKPLKIILHAQILSLIDNDGNYFAKLVVFRGNNTRGYSSKSNDSCYHICIKKLSKYKHQKELAVSNIVLSKQIYLSGIKHLNRLEQVLAANELLPTKFNDAVMIDERNNIIETTNKNIIFIRDKVIYSPLLNNNGVYGVALRWLENQGYEFKWKEIKFNSIEKYHVMMVCNSIHGFNVITSIEEKFKFKQVSPLVNEIIGKWNKALQDI